MIKITKDQTYFGGNEFELFKDLMRFHAVIMKNEELMKIDMMAMEGVKQAIKDNMLDAIAGFRFKEAAKSFSRILSRFMSRCLTIRNLRS